MQLKFMVNYVLHLATVTKTCCAQFKESIIVTLLY